MEENASTGFAWAAGLFEAEGYAGTSSRGYPRLKLSSTDCDVVTRFSEIVGGNVNGPYCRTSKDGGAYKPVWQWDVSGFDAGVVIFREFLPYLGWRRRAAMHRALLGDDISEEELREVVEPAAPRGEHAVAWAAGVIEGDGCISLPDDRAGVPSVTVAMTDQDVVRRVGRVFARGNIGGPYHSARGRKAMFQWRVSGWTPCRRVLMPIYPWLGERRRERADEFFLDWLDAS